VSTIAFIGLGIMGAPMAVNLVRAGHDVVGVNRSPAKCVALVDQGGRRADTVAEAVRGADVVITMLPDTPDVEAVALGADGVLAHADRGSLVIDMSTIRPDMARRVASEGTDRGLHVLDAPVSGGEQGAIDGTLSVMVGGEPEAFELARRVLEALGSTVVHVGPAGSGQTVKAANQLIVAGNLALVSEALVFLEAHGVDTASATQVLAGGLAGSTVLERKARTMIDRDFRPGFRLELHHKDLGIVRDAARQAGVVTPVGSLVAELVAALTAQGHGQLDHSALLMMTEQLSGRAGDRARTAPARG